MKRKIQRGLSMILVFILTFGMVFEAPAFRLQARADDQVAKPEFSPAAGTYTEAQSVTISCATEGATIYYTTDGTTPTNESEVYSSAIPVLATTTIKAIAVKSGSEDSAVAEATYTINSSAPETVATPTFSLPGGTYAGTQSVEISCATEDAVIYYTLDGSEPTASGTLYSSAIEVSESKTIKAKAFKDGMTDSAVAEATYTINNSAPEIVATPTFSLPGGTYAGTQSVEISCATEDAVIYYTLNGEEPTTSDALYIQAIEVAATTTIKAKAFKDGMTASAVAEAAYTIDTSFTFLNNDYPYGKDMGTSQITLVIEITSTEGTYQWQVADAENGTFSSIGEATADTYTFTPTHGMWYRCLVNGVASKAVQAVKPSSDSRTWAAGGGAGSFGWYLSNGPMAYTMTSNNTFDVVGEYVKDSTTYMLCTSYSGYWTIFGGNGTEGANTADTPEKMRFSFNGHGVVINASGLRTGNFSFGCDTQLGNNATSGGYSDSAALIAELNKDRTLKQIAMIGAASKTAALENDPAFVIAPAGNPMFWIGRYGGRTTYGYNTSGSPTQMTQIKDHSGGTKNVVTAVEGTDSGMTMSWKGVTEVTFRFAVGTAKDTGAISADVDYESERIKGLDPNTDYIITVLDKETGEPVEPAESYTIKALPHEAGDAGKGYILLEGEDTSSAPYSLLGKMISIAKVGSDDEPGELEIGARPDPTNIETNDPGANAAGKPIDIRLSDAEITATTISIVIDPKDDHAEAKKKQEYRLVAENGSELTYSSSPAQKANGWTMPDINGRITLSGLTPDTKYKIQTRIPCSDNAPASAILESEVKTACEITLTVPEDTVLTPTDDTPAEVPPVTVSGGSNPSVAYSTALSEPYSTTLPSFLAGGRYTVYYRVTQTGSATIYGSYTVTINPTITFEANGGTVTDITAGNKVTKISDDKVRVNYGSKPNSLTLTATNDGKTLAGWYTDESFKNLYWATNSLSDAPEVYADMTLYARWVDAVSTVSIPAESLPEGTTKIQLRKGSTPVPNDTWVGKSNGSFSIGTVPDGEYDLVIRKNMSGIPGDKPFDITARVKVEGGNISFLDGAPAFPEQNISSVVTVEPGAPAVVVSGLEQEALAEDQNGKLIHWEWVGTETNPYAVLELTFDNREDLTGLSDQEANSKLKSTEEKNIHKAEKAISALAGSGAELEFYDISVIRTDHWGVRAEEEEVFSISELSRPIEIAIPYTAPAGKTVRVFRYHDGSAQELQKLTSRPSIYGTYQDGTCYVADGMVYIYSKFFSIYAISTSGSSAPVQETLKSVTIFGTPAVGATLKAITTPSGATNLSYEWYADGQLIAGANGRSYTPTEADLGKKISVKVTQNKGQSKAVTVTSGAIGPVEKKSAEVPTAQEIKETLIIDYKNEKICCGVGFELALDPEAESGSDAVSVTALLDNDQKDDVIYIRRSGNKDSCASEWVAVPIELMRGAAPNATASDNSSVEKGSVIVALDAADKGKALQIAYKGTDGEWHELSGPFIVGEDGKVKVSGLPKGNVELRIRYAATDESFASKWWTHTVQVENGEEEPDDSFGIWFAELYDDPYEGVCYNEEAKRYEIVYTGTAINPLIKVSSEADGILKEGIDYTVSYSNNKKVSTKKPALIKVSGKGNYKKKKQLELYILPCDLSVAEEKGMLTVPESITVQSGKKLKPVIVYNGYQLKNKDMTLSVTSAVTADTTVDISGKGSFSGTLKDVPVKVLSKEEVKSNSIFVTLKAQQHIYNGEAQELTVATAAEAGELTVKAGKNGAVLEKDTDFVLSYSGNVNAGTAVVTVSGIGSYSGTETKSFKIQADKAADIKAALADPEASVSYSPRGAAPEVVVSTNDGETVLTEGRDYRIRYANNKKLGNGTYSISFMGNYKGHAVVKGTFSIVAAGMEEAVVDAGQQVYRKPGKYRALPLVSVNGVQLKKSEYTVRYFDGEKELAASDKITFAEGEESRTITIKITAKGNYSGEAEGSYEIVKPKEGVMDLSKAKIVAKEKNAKGKDAKVGKQEYTGYAIEP